MKHWLIQASIEKHKQTIFFKYVSKISVEVQTKSEFVISHRKSSREVIDSNQILQKQMMS